MNKASVLIVEDEAIVALDLKSQLEAAQYEVVGVADSAAQALELARRHHPAVTLMDVHLRGTGDGIEAAAAIGRELASPVIFLTSYSDAETVRRAAETAAYGYLTKPFQIKELIAGIEVALYKAGMERRLREADRWFASTLRCVTDAVLVTNAGLRLRFMNAAAERLTGWSLEQAMGQPLVQLVAIEGDEGVCARALRVGRALPVEFGLRFASRDGAQRVVDRSGAPVDDEAGQRLGAVLLLRDASARLVEEERLRASEQRFRSAFDHAPLGMALVALDGRHLLANPALATLLQKDRGALLASTQLELTHPDDRAHEAQRLHELLSTPAAVVQFEKRFLLAGSTRTVPALVSASLLHERGEPSCLLYQVHDLTEQKLAAEQLALLAEERLKREASETASRMKDEFLSRVSHEMRTPLNAVLGFGQLLRLREGGDTKSTAFANHIVQAGQHLLDMVNDLLDLQRGEQGPLPLSIEDVDLAGLVAEVVAMLEPTAQAQQVTAVVDLPAGLRVRADRKRLRQVLLNIGSNAIKYNRHGGTVRWQQWATPPQRVGLAVSDDGIGMTTVQLEHLFQPFERLGREKTGIAGTGLGLVIARNLLQNMHGELRITSEADHGTTVSMELVAAA